MERIRNASLKLMTLFCNLDLVPTMVELWVSAHCLTEMNISVKLDENLLNGSGYTEKYGNTCGQMDGRMDR